MLNTILSKRRLALLMYPPLFIMMCGCSAAYHARQVRNPEEKMTLGQVQREIRVGMSAADVASILGSPNIVTTDEERREVWIYDKMSRTTAYSSSVGGVAALVLGVAGSGGGVGGAGLGGSAGAESSSQRTLTVIIKFDSENRVRDFAYHTSSF